MIDGLKSLLPLVVFDAATNWDSLLTIPGIHLEGAGLRRLRHLLNGNVQSIAVERHYLDKDYRDTFSSFHSKRFSTPSSRCDRLHFFSGLLSRADMLDGAKLQAQYVGYSIVRPTRPNSVGRTLIDPERLGQAHGWMRLIEERVSIQGIQLRVMGFPFISQDADVTVCAQSALWMILRFFSNRYHSYREIYPSEIGMLVKDYSIGRIFPSSGLTDWQMAECLRQLGFAPLIYSRASDPKHLFNFLLYTYIESGFPLLLSFSNHVVVGYGHESDFSRSVPAGTDPITTSHFNTSYVVSDDNTVPYQLLGDVAGAPHSSAHTLADVEAFIVPLPTTVHLPADDAYGLVCDLLKDTQLGYSAKSQVLNGQRLVLRLFLTTCRSFKRHLASRGMGHSRALDLYRQLPLPHFIWVCEISTPGEFANQKVWGEVIWDATRNAYEPNGWIALHYPEIMIIDVGSTLNRLPDVKEFPLPGGAVYPVYCHNLQRIH